MKKVTIGLAFDSTFDCDAGVQQYFKSLGRYLLKQGHSVKFLVPYSNGTGEFAGKILSLGNVFNPFFNTTSIPIGRYTSRSRIISALQKEKFDIIHMGVPVSPFSLGKLLQTASCPVVATFMSHSQNKIHRAGMYFLSSILMKSNRYIDAFTAPNAITKIDANAIIPGNYTIISHAVDLTPFTTRVSPIKKYQDGRFNLLFFGRLEERKGVHLLVECMPEIVSNHRDVRLIIAGDGPLRVELEERTITLGISDHIVFEGYINEKDKASYFATADLCVFPALYGECFGIVLIEALASGKIPLAFANEGYNSVLENIPEVLVPAGNTEKLTARILELISDTAERKRLEKECREESRRYSWETVGKQITKIYESILD